MARRRRRARSLSSRAALGAAIGAAALGPVPGAAAQAVPDTPSRTRLALSADLGGAFAEYDGYLPSAVASLSPRALVAHGPLQLMLRGALSRFESGSMAASGAARASWVSPAVGRARLELAGAGGTLFYREGSPSANDLLGVARLHVRGDGATSAWVGAGRGRTATEIVHFGVARVEAGLRARLGPAWLTTVAEHTDAGPARYTDLSATAAGAWARGDLQLTAGLRADEGRGGTGSWAEAGASLQLTARHALVAGVGRYLYDASTSSPGARYVSLAVRMSSAPARASPRTLPREGIARALGATALLDLPPPEPPPVTLVAEAITLEPTSTGVRLGVRAPAATQVEIAGDFSDWQPVALARDASGLWRAALALPAGAHRINLRVDGGPWGVPPGLPVVADDFGGSAGLIVIR